MVESTSVVLVTHDAPAGLLERAVESILAADLGSAAPGCSLFVVDNGGGARRRLARHEPTWPDRLEVIEARNDGFGAAVNVGVRAALAVGADAIAVLNDDVEVPPGWMAALNAEFADPGVGAVQPLLVSADGERVNSAGVEIDAAGQGSDRRRDERTDSIGGDATDLELFTGGAVVFRSDFLRDVGGFDERFFLYYEDVELGRRGAARGWRYRLVPDVHVRHAGSATTASMGSTVVYLRERNRLWCAAMTGTPAQWSRALWLSLRRVRRHPRRVHLRAVGSGVVGSALRIWNRRCSRLRAPTFER